MRHRMRFDTYISRDSFPPALKSKKMNNCLLNTNGNRYILCFKLLFYKIYNYNKSLNKYCMNKICDKTSNYFRKNNSYCTVFESVR